MTDEHKNEIAELVDQKLDGTTDDACRERLRHLLRGNPDGQAWYVEYCQMHAMLAWEHGGMPSVEFCGTETAGRSFAVAEANKRSARRWQTLAIAASVMLLASVSWLIYGAVTDSAPPITKTKSSNVDTHVRECVPAGVLLLSDNPVWGGAAARPGLGEPVLNTTLTLISGSVQIALFGGAKVNLQGPCQIEVESDKRVFLRHGDILVSILDDETELVIDTPVGELLHLGTEFGVSVAETGDTEMYVFDGAVEVKQDGDGLPAGSARIFRVGDATRLATSGRVEDLGSELHEKFRLNHPPLAGDIGFKPRPLTIDKAGYRVRYLKVDNVSLNCLSEADAVLAGRVVAAEDATIDGVPFIDFQDHGKNRGEKYLRRFFLNVFAHEQPFPGDRNGRRVNDDHFLIHAMATIVVHDAWRYTFLLNVDDGARLRIDGKDVIIDDGIHPPRISLGTVLLTPGQHKLELVAYEESGFARVELGYALGETNRVERFVPLGVAE